MVDVSDYDRVNVDVNDSFPEAFRFIGKQPESLVAAWEFVAIWVPRWSCLAVWQWFKGYVRVKPFGALPDDDELPVDTVGDVPR